jgi:hypothetical protein
LALSKSKVPPQQSNGPLDVFDQFFGFRAHESAASPLPAGFNEWTAPVQPRLGFAALGPRR